MTISSELEEFEDKDNTGKIKKLIDLAKEGIKQLETPPTVNPNKFGKLQKPPVGKFKKKQFFDSADWAQSQPPKSEFYFMCNCC